VDVAVGVEVGGTAHGLGGDELVHGGAIVGRAPGAGTVGCEQGEEPRLGLAVTVTISTPISTALIDAMPGLRNFMKELR